jgi:hypothetical protein
MLDQNRVVVNNVEKGRRDHLLKGHGWDRPSVDIRMLVSPTIEEANPPKIEFFDTVARLKAGLA